VPIEELTTTIDRGWLVGHLRRKGIPIWAVVAKNGVAKGIK
jgi:hypothetical protein